MSKLEKIARQYGIDPATLPPVDGKSVTINTAQLAPRQPVPIPSKEARQSELERLRADAQAANKRLRDYERADRERILAARAAAREAKQRQ